MEFPADIRVKIDELCEKADTKALRSAFIAISENYRLETRAGKKGVTNKTEALCYAAVRMPATFAAVSRALELSLECFNGEINTVLDAGAGTGAGAIAASQLTKARDIICVERESAMFDLGMLFCRLGDVNSIWEKGDVTQNIEGEADLVLCSYCFNELPENNRIKALEHLAESTKKMLVIVDPGTPWSFEAMKKARQHLIKQGFKIAAPCPHSAECTLDENDWCHFTVRAQRSKTHKLLKGVSVPYEDEKFCFLAAVKGDYYTPCEARVIRKPRVEKGKVILEVCDGNGFVTHDITKTSTDFKIARKAESGDKFSTTTNNQ